MSPPIRGHGGHLVFSDRPEKHKLRRGHCDLVPVKFRYKFRSTVPEGISKLEARVAILVFRSA